jgi:prevent-host-death family protein
MRIAPLADVKARLSGYVDEVSIKGPVIITRNGKPVAVLLAPQDEEDLERLILAHSPKFQALLERSRERIRAGRRLTHSAFWKAVAERRKAKKASG